LLSRALWEQGIRQVLPAGVKRHEWKGSHGYRKAFKSRAEQVMRPANVEILHSREILILDEAHLLETEIVKFTGISISKRKWKRYLPDFKMVDHGYNDIEKWIDFLTNHPYLALLQFTANDSEQGGSCILKYSTSSSIAFTSIAQLIEVRT
jgi:hypothetical protein